MPTDEAILLTTDDLVDAINHCIATLDLEDEGDRKHEVALKMVKVLLMSDALENDGKTLNS